MDRCRTGRCARSRGRTGRDEPAGESGARCRVCETGPRGPLRPLKSRYVVSFFVGLVEDVERAVEIVDEEPRGAPGSSRIEFIAREHLVGLSLAVEGAGDRHRDVVLEVEREVGVRGGCSRRARSAAKRDVQQTAQLDERIRRIVNAQIDDALDGGVGVRRNRPDDEQAGGLHAADVAAFRLPRLERVHQPLGHRPFERSYASATAEPPLR